MLRVRRVGCGWRRYCTTVTRAGGLDVECDSFSKKRLALVLCYMGNDYLGVQMLFNIGCGVIFADTLE